MLGNGYISNAYDRGSLKRKYEAYDRMCTLGLVCNANMHTAARGLSNFNGFTTDQLGANPNQKEWTPSNDKCTILLLGPNDVGKAFLVNTLLSSTYGTSRVPTLGGHRQSSRMGQHRSNESSSSSSSSRNTTNTLGPTFRRRDSQACIHHPRNLTPLYHKPYLALPSLDIPSIHQHLVTCSNKVFQEVDKEFLLEDSFNRGADWEKERQLEMQEIYATSQYHFTRSHSINDGCAFVIPQGHSGVSIRYVVTYGAIPQLLVSFIEEHELRRVLWQLHEAAQVSFVLH